MQIFSLMHFAQCLFIMQRVPANYVKDQSENIRFAEHSNKCEIMHLVSLVYGK